MDGRFFALSAMRSGCRAAAFEPGREYKFIKMSAALNNFGSDLDLHHNLKVTNEDSANVVFNGP
ncbi:hypothetical protein T484DRAFT_1816515 [Baffinella frigidus]|nr:hypothetical protein T484DRAFT_1816515 [Cryptophyta sp. CCMP2293]